MKRVSVRYAAVTLFLALLAVATYAFEAWQVSRIEARAAEVKKLGFESVLLPKVNRKGASFPDGLKVQTVERLGQALDAVL